MELSAIVPLPISVAEVATAAFLPLAGEAPLLRIVRAMVSAVAEPARVVVGAAEPLVFDVDEILAGNGLSAVGVAVATGPGSRAQCLTAGLERLDHEGVSTTHVLIPDVRQPLVAADLCARVAAGLTEGSAVVLPALPVTDSVKAVDEYGSVTATLDRSALRVVQFPRGFAVDQLTRLLTRRVSDEFDEVEEAVRAGEPITVVDGDAEAFVVDLPQDAPIVEAIIATRQPDRG